MSVSTKYGSALLSLTNVDADSPRTVEVDLRGARYDLTQARILTAEQLSDHNTTTQPGLVTPRDHEEIKRSGETLTIQLPAHSFVAIEVETSNCQQR